jgi:hypothetical protein
MTGCGWAIVEGVWQNDARRRLSLANSGHRVVSHAAPGSQTGSSPGANSGAGHRVWQPSPETGA